MLQYCGKGLTNARQRHRAARFVTIVVMAGTLLAACATQDSRARALENTLETYAAAIRWGDFRGAAGFLHPDERPSEQSLSFELQRFEQIRVTGYKRGTQGPSGDVDTYIQLVEIRMVNRHTARERVIRDRQVWRYESDSERWWLISGLPNISRN